MATYTLVPLPRIGILPEAGMLIYTYAAGGATPAATYQDSNGFATNTNPVQADGNGLFPAIYLPLGTSYKFIATHAVTNGVPPDPIANLGVVIWTQDGIASVPASSPATDVSGTFGEPVLAFAAVYLSKGSGEKQAGLWYNADNTNDYSSSLPIVGIATSGVVSGMTGVVRVEGALAGFSGLSIDFQYVGLAGALTSAPPTHNRRFVGQADTTTSMVVAGNPPVLPVLPITTPTNGQLFIGNGQDYALAALSAGTGFTVTNAAGSITLTNNSVVLDKSTTEQEVVNTSVETSVYSFAVPGNTLGTSKTIRHTLTASYLNNSGGADNFTPRVKFGGTTIASSAPSQGSGASRRTMKFIIEINANGATNSQRAVSIWFQGASAAENAFDTALSATSAAYNGSLALDSTGALTFTVTVQHGTAATTISFKRYAAITELLG